MRVREFRRCSYFFSESLFILILNLLLFPFQLFSYSPLTITTRIIKVTIAFLFLLSSLTAATVIPVHEPTKIIERNDIAPAPSSDSANLVEKGVCLVDRELYNTTPSFPESILLFIV